VQRRGYEPLLLTGRLGVSLVLLVLLLLELAELAPAFMVRKGAAFFFFALALAARAAVPPRAAGRPARSAAAVRDSSPAARANFDRAAAGMEIVRSPLCVEGRIQAICLRVGRTAAAATVGRFGHGLLCGFSFCPGYAKTTWATNDFSETSHGVPFDTSATAAIKGRPRSLRSERVRLW
jgi:hypothetical protein